MKDDEKVPMTSSQHFLPPNTNFDEEVPVHLFLAPNSNSDDVTTEVAPAEVKQETTTTTTTPTTTTTTTAGPESANAGIIGHIKKLIELNTRWL